MKKPLVVLPRRTSQSPDDAHIGEPHLTSPHKIGVHIPCCFTWDKEQCLSLQEAWKGWGANVKIGGPAFDDPGDGFISGLYVKTGVTITSRGCLQECPWCYVPKREGKIRELKTIIPGNTIQDNNLLACSRRHVQKVFDMLQGQHRIRFLGGLDCRLLSDQVIDRLRGLNIKEVWIAADSPEGEKAALKVIGKLAAGGFPPWKIRCYVLAGYFKSDSPDKAEERLLRLKRAGCYPFIQLYDGKGNHAAWKDITRKWSRPGIYMATAEVY